MKTVHKYALHTISDKFSIGLPAYHEILCVQIQNGHPYIWVLVDPDEKCLVAVNFRIAGTGHPIEEVIQEYIGTFQLNGGSLVFHLFVV